MATSVAYGPHLNHPAAFDAIAATSPLGSVGYEAQLDAQGQRLIWLESAIVDRLAALRGPGESYSDVILRLVEMEAGQRAQAGLHLSSTRAEATKNETPRSGRGFEG